MYSHSTRIGEARTIYKFNQPPSAFDDFRKRYSSGSPEEQRQHEARERGQKSDIDRFRDTTEQARKLQERVQQLDRVLQQKIETLGKSVSAQPAFEMSTALKAETAAVQTLDAYRGRLGFRIAEFRRSLDGVQGGDLRRFHEAVERRERILQETEQVLREYEQKAGLNSPPIEVASIERMSPDSLSQATERVKPPVERLYPYGWRDGPGQGGRQQRLILSFSTGWGREQNALPNVSGNQGAMHLGLRQSIMLNNIQGARPLGQEGTERGFGANDREADEMGDIQRSLAEMGIQVRQTPNGTLVRITYIPAHEYIVIEGEKIWGPIGTKPVPAQNTVARRPSFAEWQERRDANRRSTEREPVQGTLQHIAEIAGRNSEARRACEQLRADLQSTSFRWRNPDLRAADELIRRLARNEGVSDRDMNRVAPRNPQQLLRFIKMVLAAGGEPLMAQAPRVKEGGMASAPSEAFALFAEPKEEPVPAARTKPTPEPHTPSLFSTPSPRSTTPKKATPTPKLRPKTKPKPTPKVTPAASPSDAVPPEPEMPPAEPIISSPSLAPPRPPESEKKIEKLDGKKFSDLITWKTTEGEAGAEKIWKQRLDEQATPKLLEVLGKLDYLDKRVLVKGEFKESAAELQFTVGDHEILSPTLKKDRNDLWARALASNLKITYEKETKEPKPVPEKKPAPATVIPEIKSSEPAQSVPAPMPEKPAPKPAEPVKPAPPAAPRPAPSAAPAHTTEELKAMCGQSGFSIYEKLPNVLDAKIFTEKQMMEDFVDVFHGNDAGLRVIIKNGKVDTVFFCDQNNMMISGEGLSESLSKANKGKKVDEQFLKQLVVDAKKAVTDLAAKKASEKAKPATKASKPERPPASRPASKEVEEDAQKRLPSQVKTLIKRLITDKNLDTQKMKDGALVLAKGAYSLELRLEGGTWQYILHTNTDKTSYSAKNLLTEVSKWGLSAQQNYEGFIKVVETLSGEKMPEPAEAKPAPITQPEAGPVADLPNESLNEMSPEIAWRLINSTQGADETISNSVDRLMKIIPVIQSVKGDVRVRQFLGQIDAQISLNTNLAETTRAKLKNLQKALQ